MATAVPRDDLSTGEPGRRRTDADELHDLACRELAEVCGVVNAGHGRMVRLMVDVLADDAWTGCGILSPLHWLTWKTSLSRAAASAVVNLAKRASELESTVSALSEGRLSLESAGLIARFVPAEYEHSVLELASVLTVSQLRRTVSRYHFDLENPEPEPAPGPSADETPDGDGDGDGDGEPDAADGQDTANGGSEGPDGRDRPHSDQADGSSGHDGGCCGPHGPIGMQGGRFVWPTGRPIEERIELTMGHGDTGGWSVSAHLPGDWGAIFETAVRTRRAELYRLAEKELGPDDPRPKVTLADALMSIMEGSLTERAAKLPGTDRFLIHAHLTGAPDGGNALSLHLGATLPHHLRRLYTCDGTIRPVLETDGIPVNVGRLQRIVSRRVRRLIEHRDGGCAVPGCGKRHALEVHHIWHWEDGGLTTTDNLLTLCRMHHRLHHLGHLRIWGNADGPRHTADGVQFADASGRLLAPVGAAVAPPTGEPLHRSARRVGLDPADFEPAIGERLDNSQVYFSRKRRTAAPDRAGEPPAGAPPPTPAPGPRPGSKPPDRTRGPGPRSVSPPDQDPDGDERSGREQASSRPRDDDPGLAESA